MSQSFTCRTSLVLLIVVTIGISFVAAIYLEKARQQVITMREHNELETPRELTDILGDARDGLKAAAIVGYEVGRRGGSWEDVERNMRWIEAKNFQAVHDWMNTHEPQ